MLSPGTQKVRILLQLAAKKDGKSDTLLSNFSKNGHTLLQLASQKTRKTANSYNWSRCFSKCAYFTAVNLTKDRKKEEEKNGELLSLSLVSMLHQVRIPFAVSKTKDCENSDLLLPLVSMPHKLSQVCFTLISRTKD